MFFFGVLHAAYICVKADSIGSPETHLSNRKEGEPRPAFWMRLLPVHKVPPTGVVSKAAQPARQTLRFPTSMPFLVHDRTLASNAAPIFRYLLSAPKRVIHFLAAFAKPRLNTGSRATARVLELKRPPAVSGRRYYERRDWTVKL